MENLINFGIILTYIMVGIAALTAVGFGVVKMIQNTENAKKTILTIGGLAAVLIISYFIAADNLPDSYKKYEITSETSKQVGMGLITFYVLIGSAMLAVLYSELSKAFSK